MAAFSNPYTPNAGARPRVLVGVSPALLAEFERRLERAEDQVRGTLLLGPRGTGKSTLLDEFVASAQEQGWVTSRVLLKPGLNNERDFADVFVRASKQIRDGISLKHKAWATGKQLARALAFEFRAPDGGGLVIRLPESDQELTIEEAFTEVLTQIGEIVSKSASLTGVLFVFDEIQYLSDDPATSQYPLSALTVPFTTVALGSPVMLVLAGLPSARSLIASAQPNALRSLETVELTALSLDMSSGQSEAAAAVETIATRGGYGYQGTVAQQIAEEAGGYLAGIQSLGHALLDHAFADGVQVIDNAYYDQQRMALLQRMDDQLYLGEYERATPDERLLLRALADAGEPFALEDLPADPAQRDAQMAELIARAFVYETNDGRYDFSYGGFGSYLRRRPN